jgi:hypothetical protein
MRYAIRAGWPRQALLFLTAYLIYGASRWVLTGNEATALEHARWIADLEGALGVAVEAPVQQALDGTAMLWFLNHAYVAAQVVVVTSSSTSPPASPSRSWASASRACSPAAGDPDSRAARRCAPRRRSVRVVTATPAGSSPSDTQGRRPAHGHRPPHRADRPRSVSRD